VPKVVYGQVFFVQRAFIAAVLACKVSYGLQQGLIEIAIMTKTLYLLWFHPYKKIELAHADILNEFGLLLLQILSVGATQFNTDATNRYDFGLVYDTSVCVLFGSNIFLIFVKVGSNLAGKIRTKCMLRSNN